jgi:hypothetical protein
MNSDVQNDLDRIDESLSSLTDTAEGIAVDAGLADPPSGLDSRARTLSKAIEGVRSDLQELRESIG